MDLGVMPHSCCIGYLVMLKELDDIMDRSPLLHGIPSSRGRTGWRRHTPCMAWMKMLSELSLTAERPLEWFPGETRQYIHFASELLGTATGIANEIVKTASYG